MIAVAMLALVLAGGLSYGLAMVFFAVMIVSWNLEGTRWQLPERYGLAIVLLSIPLFYLEQVRPKFPRNEQPLTRLIKRDTVQNRFRILHIPPAVTAHSGRSRT